MADFNLDESRKYQNQVIDQLRVIRDEMDRDVINYYYTDGAQDEGEAQSNLRGIHRYLKDVYQKIDRMLTDLERHTY
ncbi:MAG: hypothetical protein PHS53_01800 [Candidatus Pacebacteria bacterium]|nr:hypothetical protein [Candidatus Paceibacterota bacterium]MDD5356862.1 hypothetical protein [Candidatus Paceibacterota bacterium]